MPRILRLLTLLLALLALTSSAFAGKPVQLVVLDIMSEDASMQADALTVALKNAVRRTPTLSLGAGEFSLEVLVLALGCTEPPDSACLERIANKSGVDRFIWGIMRRHGKDVVTYVNLWERGGPGAQTKLRYSVNLTESSDDTLRELAQRAIHELTAGKDADEQQEGSLVITAGNVTGEIFIDGEPAGRIKRGYVELMVPTGRRYVSVVANGYETMARMVRVHGDGPTDLMFDPRRVVRHDSVRHDQQYAAEPDSSEVRTGGYYALGIGAALIGGGIYSTVRTNSIRDSAEYVGYRDGVAGRDECAEAKRGTVVSGAAPPERITDLCSEAKVFDALQFVLYGLGSISAGTGIIILLTEDGSARKKSETGVSHRLSVDPLQQRVDFTLRF